MKLALPARAKLNLELEVLGRNADGFHDLRTTFQAIELHDTLEIEAAPATGLEVTGLELKETGENSVLKAQRILERAAGRELPARIQLHKRIPPGSGFGGASSDAAAALRGLSAIYALGADLAPIAREVGADVPFFLTGGRASGEGRGERLMPLTDELAWFALAWPGIELSTADVYRAWDEVNGEAPNDLRRGAEHIEPRLHDFAAKLGPGWRMTGSGSAFFMPVSSEQEGRKAIDKLDCWKTVTHSVGRWA